MVFLCVPVSAQWVTMLAVTTSTKTFEDFLRAVSVLGQTHLHRVIFDHHPNNWERQKGSLVTSSMSKGGISFTVSLSAVFCHSHFWCSVRAQIILFSLIVPLRWALTPQIRESTWFCMWVEFQQLSYLILRLYTLLKFDFILERDEGWWEYRRSCSLILPGFCFPAVWQSHRSYEGTFIAQWKSTEPFSDWCRYTHVFLLWSVRRKIKRAFWSITMASL